MEREQIGVGRPIPASEADLKKAGLVAGRDYKLERVRFLHGLHPERTLAGSLPFEVLA